MKAPAARPPSQDTVLPARPAPRARPPTAATTKIATGCVGGVAPASNRASPLWSWSMIPPRSAYYGGDVAAPVFSAVVGGALRLMGVAPDATTIPHWNR